MFFGVEDFNKILDKKGIDTFKATVSRDINFNDFENGTVTLGIVMRSRDFRFPENEELEIFINVSEKSVYIPYITIPFGDMINVENTEETRRFINKYLDDITTLNNSTFAM